MLQKSTLEPHFLHKALLEPKWDHHTRADKPFFTILAAPGKAQNSQKSVKSRYQNLAFFWNASWKASWKVLRVKLEPKPWKITPKMGAKEINRAYKKLKDFERKTWSKNTRKTILETNLLKTQKSENVDCS